MQCDCGGAAEDLTVEVCSLVVFLYYRQCCEGLAVWSEGFQAVIQKFDGDCYGDCEWLRTMTGTDTSAFGYDD